MTGQFQYVIGMDCGTTNIKAVVLGEDGRVIAEASRPNRFLSPGHMMHEQNAEDWWRNAAEIFQTLTKQIGPGAARRVRGVCVSSHTVTLLPVNAAGTPLRPAMTYQDGRSARELEEILDTVGRERFIRIVGGQPSVAFLPSKLLWYARHEPALFAQTAAFLQASSYINFKLTGVMCTDIDQALRTQCMDMETQRWSEEIASALGMEFSRYMPPVAPAEEIIGTVSAQAAAETGLAEGTRVLNGCSDAMAAMVATGMSRLGEAGESSGTTSLVFVGSAVHSAPDVPVVARPSVIPGIPWLFDAPIQSTGAAIKWLIDKLAAEERAAAAERGSNIYDYLNELALRAVPGSHGLFFFPYLLGERAPLWNNYSRGMFIGMRMDMKRSELVRSVFEGTAYALRHVIETVRASGGEAELLRVCGGGAKSHAWNRIKASVLHMPVHVLSAESGDVPVGDALLAGLATGVFADLGETVQKVVRVAKVVEPDPEWVRYYDSLYPYYLEMYGHLDGDLMRLQQTLRALYP